MQRNEEHVINAVVALHFMARMVISMMMIEWSFIITFNMLKPGA